MITEFTQILPQSKKFTEAELCHLTFSQLTKDFRMCAIEVPEALEDEELDLKTKLEQLHQVISALIEADQSSLMSLLYRVDVPDSQVRKALVDGEDIDSGKSITMLLLKRELSKVLIRSEALD